MITKIYRSWFKKGLKHLHGLAYWLYDRAYTSHLMELNTQEYKAKRDHFKERFLDCVVLNKYNIIVAVKGGGHGDWTAYAPYESLRGFHREDDLFDVATHGSKLDYRVARRLFPDIDAKYEWRS